MVAQAVDVTVPPEIRDTTETHVQLGGMPLIALLTSLGIASIAIADALSRQGRAHSESLFWLGLAAICLPAFARLTSVRATRGERVALVVVLGLGLYLVKVLRDPFGFTYADELVHQHNALTILTSGSLFGHNPILPVTSSYPGLEAADAALASLTGLSTFSAGLVLIGAARLVMMLALFLLFEVVSSSPRLAGVATALYAATPTFLFFGAQFSYESLALPLAAFAVYAALRASRGGSGSWSWTTVGLIAIVTVVVTHHLTAYALTVLLVAVVVVTAAFRLGGLRQGVLLAGTAVVATGLWLVVVASKTVGYLSPVITGAINATVRTATQEAVPRTPFRSAAGSVAPAWERVVGVTSVLIVAAAQPYGVVVIWKRYRRTAIAVVLTIASIAYVAAFALRLVPQAWETGARASEFLFVGGSFVVAVAAIELIDRARRRAIARACVCSAAAVVFIGGVISATPAGFRTAQPYRVEVTGATIEPPVVAAARWVRRELPGRSPLAAEEADGRVILIYGDRNVVVGTFPDIRDVLQMPTLPLWQLQLLRREHVRYVVVDKRKASADVVSGYFFPSSGYVHDERFSRAVVTKFERAGASRIYDDGDVIIDDIKGVSDAAATP